MSVFDSHLLNRFLDMAQFFLEQEQEQSRGWEIFNAGDQQAKGPQTLQADSVADSELPDGLIGRELAPLLIIELEVDSSEAEPDQSQAMASAGLVPMESEPMPEEKSSPLDIGPMLPTIDTQLMDQLPGQANIRQRKVSLHEFIAAEDRKWEQQHTPPLVCTWLKSQSRTAIPLKKGRRTMAELFVLDLEHGPPEDYSRESRLDKLIRYFRKKELRNWNRKISYRCRKEVADTRVRVRGRFVSKAEKLQLQPTAPSSVIDIKIESPASDMKSQKEESETTECPAIH